MRLKVYQKDHALTVTQVMLMLYTMMVTHTVSVVKLDLITTQR